MLKKSLPLSPMRESQTSALASQASRVNWLGSLIMRSFLPQKRNEASFTYQVELREHEW
jgi:hypothetical protein